MTTPENTPQQSDDTEISLPENLDVPGYSIPPEDGVGDAESGSADDGN